MDYDKLIFIAPAWRESLDAKTKTLVLRADFSASGFCETIVTPIPGTEPPQFTYTCLPVTCHGTCELRSRTLPDGGVIYYCECVNGDDASGSASRSAKGGSTAGKNKRKKAKKSGRA